MTLDKKLFAVGLLGVFFVASLSGCVQQPGPGTGIIIIPSVGASESTNPKNMMASYYSSDALTIESKVSPYTLPLDSSLIVNYESVAGLLGLTDQQKLILQNNGFVVKDFSHQDDIVGPYKYLKEQDIPVFFTSDTLLHLYHIQFDQILKGIEQREFFGHILDISKELFDKSQQEYATFADGDLKEAARRNIGFFGVGLSLLQTPTEGYNDTENIRTVDFTIPSYVSGEVTQEIASINAHNGFQASSIFHYSEDYSQYKPRGHYTQSETLKRYFKAMMWYGRMSFLMKGGEPSCSSCPFLLSAEDAKIQTIQACLIATALPSTTVHDVTLEELWQRIYVVTSFFVGAADDLIPSEYLTSIATVFGSQFNATDLVNDAKLFDLKVELVKLRNPQIYGGTGAILLNPPYSPDQLNEVLEKTKGMRLMGQRYIPDSYMFQQLVFPAVQEYTGSDTPFTLAMTNGGPLRVFPRGLDVMAVLGSKRALTILEQEGDTDYSLYHDQLTRLQQNFSSLNITEWNRNLYFSWVFTLKSLLSEYNGSYPTFMQTTAWQDKELHSVLASWTELRHDTILYAKQSYTFGTTSVGPTEKPVVGYVEPVPEFYTRILALTRMTRTSLTALSVLNETETSRLQHLEGLIERVRNISIHELEGKELTEDDYEFIRNFGAQLDGIIAGVNSQGKETTLIADVHTDINTGQVLEEGVGYVDLILVAYKVPDGRIMIGAGPVFSYYEFKQPMDNRLTDEQWKEQLLNGQEPSRPDWVQSFLSE